MSLCISVRGGLRLKGSVRVSGAKNSALPLMIASLLSSEMCVLHNVPELSDVFTMMSILRQLGAICEYDSASVRSHTPRILQSQASLSLMKSLRASFWVLAPMLVRHGVAYVVMPGGDAIGNRPVDLHLSGLAKMGAEIRVVDGIVEAKAPKCGLRPANISLAYPSVGATHQLLMASSAVDGITRIENVAKEPEVVELAKFLSLMGAEICGAGTSVISVRGNRCLKGATIKISGDRIEAATFLFAGAITGGEVNVNGVLPADMGGSADFLRELGYHVICGEDSVGVLQSCLPRPRPVCASTGPFPQLATDVQPLALACIAKTDGISRIEETVFESRLGHIREYCKFGAEMTISGNSALVRGVSKLRSAFVEAGDIRAAAGLVLMGLASDGVSHIRNAHHLIRGYERMDEKFEKLGASVSFVEDYGNGRDCVVGC